MGEELFDLSDEYEAMLNQGIRLSGENMFFFLEGRLSLLRRRMRGRDKIFQVLDFGSGLGYASTRLREMFPSAEITGVDTSKAALEAAQERNGGDGIRFLTVDGLDHESARYDLCYVNGVFHHIPPEKRLDTLGLIHRVLREGGTLALFENNPWNFGARLVMARIAFDRNARMLSPLDTARLLRRAGFDILCTDSLFFFPRPLQSLRFLERFLNRTRLGAQYLVLGVRR